MKLKYLINYVVILGFFLMLVIVWLRHIHPFVAMKEFMFTSAVMIAFALLVIHFILNEKIYITKGRIFLAVALLYAYTLLSYFLFPYTDPKFFYIFTCYVVLFYIISFSFNPKHRNRMIYSIMLVGFLSAIYGFFQFFGIDYGFFVDYFGSRTELGSRTFTFFGNPNLLGGFCVLLIPLCLAFLIKSIKEKKQRRAAAFGLLLLLTIISLYMSFTRGSWIAAFLSLVVFVLLYHRNKILGFCSRRKIISLIIIILLIALMVGGFLARIKLVEISEKVQFMSLSSFNKRWFYYINTMDMIKEDPLFGKGYSTFNVYYPAYRDNRIAYTLGERSQEFRVEHAHNEFIQTLSELGIIGLLLFIWIILEALSLLLKKRDIVNLGIAVSIIGLLLDGMFTQNLRYVVIGSLLWLLFGFSPIKDGLHERYKRLSSLKIILILAVILLAIIPLSYSYKLKSADYHVKEGIAYYVSSHPERSDRAIVLFNKALDLEPTNKRALYYLAISYYQKHDRENAIKAFNRLIGLDPNFIQAHYYLGVLYLETGDYQKSKEHFEKHIQINNMYWKSYYGLGVILNELGQKEEAIEALEETKEINQILRGGHKIPENELFEIKSQLANIYLQLGQVEKAIETLEIMQKLRPSDEIAKNIEELKASLN